MRFRNRARQTGLLIAIAGSLLIGAPSAWADIYWTNSGNGTIGRAYLDGTGVNESFITDQFSNPFGVAVDSSHIYWGNGDTLIGRANLDGSGANDDFIINAASGLPQGVNGVAVDGSSIYWANCCSTPTIGQAPLADPAAANPNFMTASTAPDLNAPIQVAVDPANNTIYIADNVSGVLRANLTTGGGEAILVPPFVAGGDVQGIAVGAGHIYWSTSIGTIGEADLNGNNPQTIVSGLGSPQQVAVDSTYVYWANQQANTIGRAPLADPAAADPNFITGADSPYAIAVDSGSPPVNTSGPSISGFAVGGGVLSEGRGDWTNGPTGFRYQWQSCDAAGNHCVPIPGATSQTYTEQAGDIGTTIRVEETAVNTFGTSVAATSSVTGVVQAPGTFLTGISTSGPIASLTLSCHGPQPCNGAVTLTSHERRRGDTPLAVSASRRKRVKTVTLTVGHAAFGLSVGQTETVRVRLSTVGKGLLARFYKVPTTATFTGVTISGRQITFAYPLITSPVFYTVDFFATFTSFRVLTVKSLPKRAVVQIICHGGGCPLAHRTLRPRGRHVNLTPLVGRAHLSPGAVLRVEITDTNEVGEVRSYGIVSSAAPIVGTRCLPPGARAPRACA